MITALIFLEMTSTWLFDDTVETLWTHSEVEIDPADYPGLIHAWFEAVLDNQYGAEAKTLELVDEDANVLATLTIGAGEKMKRIREEFTLNAISKKYYVNSPAVSGDESGNLNWRTTRIILEIADSAMARPQIVLAEGDRSSGGLTGDADENDRLAWFEYTSNTTYAYGAATGNDPGWFRLFKLEKSNWDTVSTWTLEVTGAVEYGSTPTGYAALFNATDGTQVAGTELTFTELVATRKTIDFASAAVNFDDGDEFELRIKVDEDAANFLVYRAVLYVMLNPALKMEVHQKVGSAIHGSTGTSRFEVDCRLLYEPGKFPAATPFYLESTAKETGGSGHQYLNNSGTQDTSVDGASKETATTATEITGTWTTPDNILAQDDALASITLNVALETAILEATGYDFDSSIPADAVISAVDLKPLVMVAGQNASLSAYFTISGADQTVHSTTVAADAAMHRLSYTCIGDRAWTRADLLDAALDVRVRANQPNNTTATTFYWDSVLIYVGWADPVAESQLDFSTVSRERQRSADLAAVLTDGNRYFVFYSTTTGNTFLDHSPTFLIAVVTGTAAAARHDFWPSLIRMIPARDRIG